MRDESNFIVEKNVVDTAYGKREVTSIVDRIYDVPEGKKCVLENRELWENFLSPVNSTSARIAAGEKTLLVFEDVQRSTGKDPFSLVNLITRRINNTKVSTIKPNEKLRNTVKKSGKTKKRKK